MRQIPLTQGKFALVDDADFEWLNQWKWTCSKKGYAYRQERISKGKRKEVKMHRLILGLTDPLIHGEHKNNNSLDNTRGNLRPSTCAQNNWNRSKRPGTTSVFKGVYWNKKASKWKATIIVDYKSIYLGLFVSEKEAALHYNKAAAMHYGEFANLNIIPESNSLTPQTATI